MRRPSFANSLVLRIGLLLSLALAVFAAGSYRLIFQPAVRSLAQAQMGLVSEQLEARAGRLFETVEVSLRISRDWAAAESNLDPSLQDFLKFFQPRIANHREISSVILADETGREMFLVRLGDGRWITRLSDPARWGRQSFWVTWGSDGRMEKEEARETDYDPRSRPWFRGALEQARDGSIFWTAPYTFYTTREPGITAAVQFSDARGRRYVIAHDVGLLKLSDFTTSLTVGQSGKAGFFLADGRLVALPRDPRFASPEERKLHVLKPPQELGLTDIAAALRETSGTLRPGLYEYTFGDQPWYALYHPIAAGNHQLWLGVFAAEAEFLPSRRSDLALLGAVALLALLAGIFVAIRLGRQFGAPLDHLAREAERIGRMDLAAKVSTAAPWREIRQLADAQETMRQRLHEATQRLDEANTALEAKVDERTRQLEDSRRRALESETFFRAIFDNAAIGISNLSPDLHRQRVNRAFAEFSGYSTEELLAGTGLDLLAPEERERVLAAYRELAEGGAQRFRTEARFLHKEGHSLWADIQLTTIRDDRGGVSSLLATILDVTDRRIVEEELARQFALVQALLDTIPNPIFYKGAHTRFLGCNTAYEEAFGVDRHRFVGRRVLDLDYLPESDRIAYQAEDEAIIASCGRAAREVTMVLADGRPHDTLYSVTGFRNPDGSPGGLIGLLVDITELKNAEREARAARAEAEAAAAAKADFLANMSHEIRTPMNAIVGMTHLAQQTSLTPRQRNYLDKVDAAAKGLLGIINDILDFSKIEAGMMRLEQADFDLEEVLGRIADLSVLKARDKGLELLFDVAPDVPRRLRGDSLRLGQVLVNLVGNALKFTQRGEITVRVGLAARDANGFRLDFSVSDTGVGLGQEEIGRLFTAFSQADTSTTRRYGGTGLGLSICKRIVTLMDGEIGVESAPGLGSRFHFDARFAMPQSAEAIAAREMDAPADLSVLVVDDNSAAREVFLHMLSGLGLNARAVASGPEALDELARAAEAGTPYGLLLSDWQMPGLDGVETVRRLRAAGAAAATPAIVMTTAYDRDELAEAVRDLDVGAVLPKPVTASALWDGIALALHAEGRSPAVIGPGRTLPREVDLDGLTVLLVEDHEVNRELAEEILAQAGVRVESAENGVAAVERLRSGARFDAVLMDCHMPVMDGFEATRLLRSEPRFGSLPILAMTAGALASDRERCLACGMNDYIAKPVDVADLYRKLAHWTGRGPAAAEAGTQISPPPRAGNSPEQAIDAATALSRLGGNARLYRHLLERFAEQQPGCLDEARTALARRDIPAAHRCIHTLKGLAGNIGAHALEAAAGAWLSAGAPEDAAAQAALSPLQEQLERALAALPQLLHGQPDPAPGNGKPAPILDPTAIARLRQLLADDDAEALRLFEEILPALREVGGDKLADALHQAITRYDFDQANNMLQQFGPGSHRGEPV